MGKRSNASSERPEYNAEYVFRQCIEMYRDAVFRRDMYSRGSAVDTCIAFVSNMYLMRIACAHVNT